MAKFTGKYFISGRIRLLTGLHIGGAKTALDIGGIDLSVIKTAGRQIPFIPGSSLKGKLRSLLAREVGSIAVNKKSLSPQDRKAKKKTDEDFPYLLEIFGHSGDSSKDERISPDVANGMDVKDSGKSNKGERIPTRLLVRDAFLDEEHFQATFEQESLDMPYTEEKWENTVNRKTGTAQHPRQLERVPAGAEFEFEMVYNCYQEEEAKEEQEAGKEAGQSVEAEPKQAKHSKHLQHLRKAMRMLEDDYLGGHGSRGYGRIEFVGVKLEEKTIADYERENQRKLVEADFLGKKQPAEENDAPEQEDAATEETAPEAQS
ncbi:MAG: type III-A CRISPR-associated RAMP protein Csm3 [Bacteroidetes bacterium]|nr:MAG: type III-A CRISPR-associated RAMP protein Csm3 [Bacteroidota bacterium]